jgi:hypothetical protein
MKKRLFLILVGVLCVHQGFSQDTLSMKFNEGIFDFRTIRNQNVPVSHKFEFINDGNKSFLIDSVYASCGCAAAEWVRDSVPPGEKGYVTAIFNPLNRPGSFNKSLTVISNAQQSPKLIFIKGIVQPSHLSARQLFPYKKEVLRFRYQSLQMGRVLTNQPSTRAFDFLNDGDTAITFLDSIDLPNHLSVTIHPRQLAVDSIGQIRVTYDAKKREDYGYISDSITIFGDDGQIVAIPLRLVATIEEYFPPMSDNDRKLAPKLKFTETSYDFGTIKEGAAQEVFFDFSNTGRQNLRIRTSKSNCACLVGTGEKDEFAPGESGRLLVRFDATGRLGSEQKSVVIFSNDPVAPTQRLTVKAKVVE